MGNYIDLEAGRQARRWREATLQGAIEVIQHTVNIPYGNATDAQRARMQQALDAAADLSRTTWYDSTVALDALLTSGREWFVNPEYKGEQR